MDLIKITTEEKNLVKNYMNDIMSFDSGIIEIIVGWDLAKERGANILNHKISKNTYWTFSPREKRKIFEEHMKSFVKEGIEGIISDVKINNLNPLEFKTEDNFLQHLKESVQSCDGYLFKNRLYIYCDRKIYHIDMGLLTFLSWDILSKIENIIKMKEYKKIPKVLGDFDIKYIPYLNAKEDNITSDLC